LSDFSCCFFDFLPLNLLLFQSHHSLSRDNQRKALIQGRNNVSDGVGVEPRSRERDHTVAVKNGALTLSALGHSAKRF